jgi:diguanylate cyclase (GGDEF)-like protein
MLTDLYQLLPASLRHGEKEPFPAELEAEYQHYIGAEKIRTIRLACALVFLLTLPFASVDVWALPNDTTLAWIVRASCFVITFAVYRATHMPQFLSRYTPISVCLFLTVGLTIQVLVALSGRADAARAIYSNGVLLPIMGMYSLSFLSIRTTFSVSFTFVAVYAAIGLGLHQAIVEGQLATVLVNMLLLASAAFIGLLAQMGRDGYERQAFLRRRALDNELLATERARQLSEHYSNHDALTGLANRKAFEQRVASLLSNGHDNHKDIAVLFIDLDGFKPVNDQHGHAIGDKVLQVVGQRISANLSRDDQVARIGGDEFVVALHLDNERFQRHDCAKLALSVAERLAQEIARPMTIQSVPEGKTVQLSVGASIGVSLASLHAKNPALLIGIADQAMYQAKRAGKGSACLADPYTEALGVVI